MFIEICAVKKYEPRLRRPKVKILEKDEFEIILTLDVEGMVATEEGPAPVMLKIEMTPDGRILVHT